MKKRTPFEFSLRLSRSETVLGLGYLLAELFLLPSLLMSLSAAVGGLSDATVNFIYYILNALFCVLIFRRLLGQSVEMAGKRFFRLIGVTLFTFAVLYGATWVQNGLIQWMLPDFSNVNDAAIAVMVGAHPILMGLGTMVLVPIAEECLFRGLLFVPFYKARRSFAYILSALAFCGVHVIGYVGIYPPQTLIVCFFQYLLAGLLLGWACGASGSLFAPMLVHSAFNAVSFFTLR